MADPDHVNEYAQLNDNIEGQFEQQKCRFGAECYKYVTLTMYTNSCSYVISLIKVSTPIIDHNMLIHRTQHRMTFTGYHAVTEIIAISIIFKYSSHYYYNEYLEQMIQNIWRNSTITELLTNIY